MVLSEPEGVISGVGGELGNEKGGGGGLYHNKLGSKRGGRDR